MNMRIAVAVFAILGMAPSTNPIQAQEPPPWDVAPAGELGSITVRNVKELELRGDELIEQVGVPMNYRLSWLTRMIVSTCGPADAFNENGPVALSLMPPESNDGSGTAGLDSLVLSIPARDRVAYEKYLRVSLADESTAVVVGNPEAVLSPLKVGRRGDQLYFASGSYSDGDESLFALEQALAGPRVASVFTPATLERLNGSHLLLHGNYERIRQFDEATRPLQAEIDALTDPDERAVGEEFGLALDHVQHLFLGIEVDQGLTISTRAQFDVASDAEARRVLIDLAPVANENDTAEPPSLAGLPDGPVIAAFCSRLSTHRRRLIVRTLGRLMQSPNAAGGDGGIFGSLDDVSLTELQQALLFGMFQEVSSHSHGMKAAAYPNADGTCGIIAIFETETPDQLVTALRHLTEQPPPDNPPGPDATSDEADAAEATKLVADLRISDSVVRTRAATRLLQIGPEAIPALEAAVAGDEPRLRGRAEPILKAIREHLASREGRLLQAGGLSALQPTLTYVDSAEVLDEHPLDIIRIALPAENAVHQQLLAEMFGPDWNTVRIAADKSHVVLTIGTVGPRLSETLRLIESGAPGLAANDTLPQLPTDDSRLIAAYIPLSRMVGEAPNRVWNAGEPKNTTPSAQLTAFGLSATPEELGVDIRLPVDEVRMLVVKRGWTW
jgi:hypothetical protein